MSLYGEAERLMRMCVDDEGNPPASPAPELVSYIGLAQVCATLAVAGELRRLNEGRDQWYREVLDVLSQAKDPEGSLRSGQPAAAPGCLICGSQASKFSCSKGATLTQAQWTAHRDEEINESVRHGADWTDAQRYADRETTERFGPCPEES